MITNEFIGKTFLLQWSFCRKKKRKKGKQNSIISWLYLKLKFKFVKTEDSNK